MPEGQDRYGELMGAELGSAFEVLSSDLTLIHANWKIYQTLFSSRERMDLLMKAAFGLFGVLRDTLLLDVVLQLARLVDRPTTFGRANLTLRCLPELVSGACDDARFACEIEALVNESCAASKFAVDWRHKRLAHRDRAVALGESEALLPQFELSDVDNSLAKAATLLNTVESYFCGGAYTAYPLVALGRPDSLFYFLEKGIDAADAEAGL
jgi:hypothetical protein